ncbi:MAG: hypothetical protein M3Y86_10765, partial [Verrucomicrobiota bacterium]|nr:hypothetical protein [Verrucomicrobiota bacterium]
RVASEISLPKNREILAAHARKIRDDGIALAKNEQDQAEIARVFEATAQTLRKQPASDARPA